MAAAASKSREATRAGWVVGVGYAGGGTEETWVGTDGEIGGGPCDSESA